MITKSFLKGMNFRKAQYTLSNGIPNKGSVYKEQVSVIAEGLYNIATERMLPGASSIKVINRVKHTRK